MYDTDPNKLVEMVNHFVLKKLFRVARSVKFLVAFTHTALADARGRSLRDILGYILDID